MEQTTISRIENFIIKICQFTLQDITCAPCPKLFSIVMSTYVCLFTRKETTNSIFLYLGISYLNNYWFYVLGCLDDSLFAIRYSLFTIRLDRVNNNLVYSYRNPDRDSTADGFHLHEERYIYHLNTDGNRVHLGTMRPWLLLLRSTQVKCKIRCMSRPKNGFVKD